MTASALPAHFDDELPPAATVATGDSQPWERPLAALRRFKWLIAASAIVGVAAGFAANRLSTPHYEARATIWVQGTAGGQAVQGISPIRAADLLSSSPAWIELFRSYRIVDAVVRRLALYLHPDVEADRALFGSFTLGQRFLPGRYELVIDRSRGRWALRNEHGATVEQGAAADTVGRAAGFQWEIPAAAFQGSGTRTVKFSVATPRETSVEMLDHLSTQLADNSNFLWLTYEDSDPRLAARTLNAWIAEYVGVAADLKKRNLVEYASILHDQLRSAETATQQAEASYQNFRVHTITLPTEGGPVAAGATGLQAAPDPAVQSFFEQKVAFDNLRHDRDALAQVIASASKGQGTYEGMLLIPSVAQAPSADALRAAFKSLYETQARLRVARQTYTDEHPEVKQLQASVAALETQTIPQLARQMLAQLGERANDYAGRIQGASAELQQIPPRTIEEMRLQRGVTVAEELYTNLKNRYAEAQLAEAGATPDVSVLDTAVAPLEPMQDLSRFFWLVAILGAVGAGAALALLLDRMDPRIRYAQQATLELGLPLAGTVPRLGGSHKRAGSPELLMQFVESFRTIRMQVLNGCGRGKPVFAVVGAAPEDGKSLVASNLALSLAEAGLRTVLVDADTRRGALHRTFGMTAGGGITEYLLGELDADQATRPTGHENLWLVSCGRRLPRSPELLVSPRLRQLRKDLAARFDVVLFDTPALAAGFDAFAVSAAAGRVLVVLRLGATQRRLAAVKLAVLDRLPVKFLGAVLNGVDLTGEFQYYSYTATPEADTALALGDVPLALDDGALLRASTNVLDARNTSDDAGTSALAQ